jgi:hypothetical protein
MEDFHNEKSTQDEEQILENLENNNNSNKNP